MDVFRQQARNLASYFQKWRTTAPAKPIKHVTEQMSESAPSQIIVAEAKTRGLQVTLLRMLQVSVVFNVALTGVILMATRAIQDQPLKAFKVKTDLRSQIIDREVTRSETSKDISYDEVLFFLHGVLSIQHEVSTSNKNTAGTPSMGLLQGLMASDIYSNATRTIGKNLPLLQSLGISQALIIRSIQNIETDPKNAGRFSAYVIGRLHQQAESTKRGIPLVIAQEYRALVVIDRLPKTSLNPYGFFLQKEEQRFGSHALQFDKEMEDRRAAKRGQ